MRFDYDLFQPDRRDRGSTYRLSSSQFKLLYDIELNSGEFDMAYIAMVRSFICEWYWIHSTEYSLRVFTGQLPVSTSTQFVSTWYYDL